MPSLQRILGLVSSTFLLMGLAYGGQSDRDAVPRGSTPPPSSALRQQVVQSLNHFPLRFEMNQGQTDKRVEFISRGPGYTLFLTGNEAVLSLRKPSARLDAKIESRTPELLRMKLVGAQAARAEGFDPLPTTSNYLLGNDPAQWHRNVPNYGKVKYANVYPGIDLVYYGNQRQLEYDFVVAPGADPRAIRFALDTGDGQREDGILKIAANGDLLVASGDGEIRFHKPVVYQPRPRSRNAEHSEFGAEESERVEGHYVLAANREVRFEIPHFDKSRPLVIDPVLSYSTYLGGSNTDSGFGIASDDAGNIYVAGETVSSNFPTKNPYQAVSNGNFDLFVAKIDAAGATLTYATYLGGAGVDQLAGMALDGSGNIFIAGTTASPNFPTTTGAFQTTFGGGSCGTDLCSDAFVTKFKSDGTGLTYSTFLGGTNADSASGLTIDGTGNALVTGATLSTNFPTASPLQGTPSGATDAFITKVKADGTGLVYSTYLGGTASDVGEAVAVDADGNAFVGGYTSSLDFPTASALQGASSGATEAFVTGINAAGAAWIFSTYLGGSADDRARAIAVDATGNIYVAGETNSADFPVSASPAQAALAAGTCGAASCADGFLTKLDPTGASSLYSTYLGGAKEDQILGVAVNGAEEPFVTGSTSSSDFPLQNPFQATIGGGTCGVDPCSDVFVARLDATGSPLVFSTFLGGGGADRGEAIYVDGNNNLLITGTTGSANFPTSLGAVQIAGGGTNATTDAIVVKIGPADAASMILSPTQLTFADQPKGFTSEASTISITNVGTAPIAVSSIAVTGDFGQTNTCEPTVATGGAACTISVTFTPATVADLKGELTITSDAPGSPHKIALAGKGIEAKSKLTFDPPKVDFPDQSVDTTSVPIPVTVANPGFADITITKIETTGEYAQTNNCPISPAKLVIDGTCTVSMTFTPKGSGVRAGGLVVTSDAGNAGSGTNSITASGTGVGVFTISATPTEVILKRGTASTTFTISAQGPATFTEAINLSCQAGSLGICAFSPASIKVGETSTLTYSGLASVTPAEHTFTVRGVNSLQFHDVSMTVKFTDYSIAVKPTFGTVSPGDAYVVKVTLSSTQGFDGSASFTCANLPQESNCSFNPTTATLDGTNPTTVDVSIQTTVRVTTWAPPRPPSTPNPWLPFGLGALALLFVLGFRRRRVTVLLLALIVLGMLATTSCNDYYEYEYTGTLPGTFPVTITSTVGTVKHTTVFYLTVL